MNRVLKTFLLWLVIAALPLQGMAAVVKATCGLKHHSMASMAMGAADHQHPDGSMHHHHDAADSVALAVPGDLLDEAGTDSNTNHIHKSSYCSACAACCIGATAPPPSLILAPIFSTAETLVIPPIVSFTGFIPAGLERPPKHFSA